MNHNILIDELPKTAAVCGQEYAVNYGYRACMLIEMEMFSDREDEQKLLNALNIFYLGRIPPDLDAAMRELLWFYRCGKEDEGAREGKTHHSVRRQQRRAYCFEADAARIYAAFRTQYGINLNQTPNNALHWWEFMAMFDSLSEDLLISRIMFYRTADLRNMGKNQREFIKKMRNIYAIRHESTSMDERAKLAKRNRDMKEYVRKRMDECRSG